MAEDLLTTFPELAGRIDEADVDQNERWHRRYGIKIPVLLDSAGGVVCITQFDSAAVAEWIADAKRS